MSYPAKPKQLSLEGDNGANVVPAAPAPPAQAAQVPTVTAGAPKLVGAATPSLLKGLDLNRSLTPAVGSGGPERWDTLRRDSFSGDNLKYVTTSTPHKITVDAVAQQQQEAVYMLRDRLEQRLKTVSPAEQARSPFWRDYQAHGQAFVAQLIADVEGRLSQAERFKQEAESVAQLTPQQTQWVRNHPLGMWLDWI